MVGWGLLSHFTSDSYDQKDKLARGTNSEGADGKTWGQGCGQRIHAPAAGSGAVSRVAGATIPGPGGRRRPSNGQKMGKVSR